MVVNYESKCLQEGLIFIFVNAISPFQVKEFPSLLDFSHSHLSPYFSVVFVCFAKENFSFVLLISFVFIFFLNLISPKLSGTAVLVPPPLPKFGNNIYCNNMRRHKYLQR